MRGGLAMHTPQSSVSVASSGSPQEEHPPSPRNSTCLQQSAQKLCASSTIVPQPAHRAGKAKSSSCFNADEMSVPTPTPFLSPLVRRRTSTCVATDSFDQDLRAM